MNKKKDFFFIVVLTFITIFQSVFGNNEKYRIMYRDDPSTSIVIGWNQISGTNPLVYYDTVDHGTNYNAYAHNQAPDRSTNAKGMTNTFVRLSGLQPNTAYYFVINDSQGTSQRFWFKTIPDDPTIRLSIISGGDSRNNRTPRQNANRLVAKIRPHAVFFGGDMTNSDSNTQWRNWMDDWQLTIGSDGRMIPIVPARGNHDSAYVVRDLFDISTSSGGEFYALSFGGNLLRSYTLNTEVTPGGTQGNWLVNDLSIYADQHYWSTAQYHRATRPHEPGKAEQNDQYTAWSLPFYTHGVQLVMESDSHVVKTTWPVITSTGSGSTQGFIRNNTDPNRTVYTGEGCWGAPLRSASDTKPWTRVAGSFNQFKWLWINQSTIELRTINVNNATSVGQVSDTNLFTEPANLNVWDHGDPANRVVIIDNPKGITLSVNGDEFSSSNVSLYPNPIGFELLIIKINSNSGDQYLVDIFDINGKLKSKQSVSSGVSKINVEGLSAGMYFMKIKSKSGLVTKKFIIK